MEKDELLEVEQLLNELSQYEYSQIKPRVARLREVLKPILDAERRKFYRSENNLKSSVDRDIVKEVVAAQGMLNGIRTMYKRAYEEVGFHDNATNDLLHALELLEGDEELVEYTKELRETRIMRREAKDFQEVVNPMVSFINKNAQVIKQFNEAVKEMESAKEIQERRTYKPRVKTEMEIAFEKALAKVEDAPEK